MSRLDELITELCPNGVEYKTLGEVAIAKTGSKPDIISESPLEFEYINAGTRNSGFTNAHNCERDVITTPSRGQGGIGFVGYQTKPFWLGPLCYQIRAKSEQLLNRFLYFVLQANTKEILARKNEGGVPSLNQSDLLSIIIPIPPLQVQHEIVRILDSFTEYTTELITELNSEHTARKKQYQYYTKLKFEMKKDVYPAKPISAFGKWSGGKTPSMCEKRFWENGSIPWISSKDMKSSVLCDTEDHITDNALQDASMTLYPKECVAIVTRSGILKHTLPVAFIPFATTVNQDIKILVPNPDVIPKYIFLAIKAYAEDIRIRAKKQGGTVDSLEFQKVLEFELPFPPIDEQRRVVSILEQFDLLCHDIINGIPTEIATRQMQYEYYRDKLLTFKQKEEVFA